ncbi:hypothetical protein GS452_04145 [Rhodococcus hoagii]|nr:hypothetical protein [Prescottella equi]
MSRAKLAANSAAPTTSRAAVAAVVSSNPAALSITNRPPAMSAIPIP